MQTSSWRQQTIYTDLQSLYSNTNFSIGQMILFRKQIFISCKTHMYQKASGHCISMWISRSSTRPTDSFARWENLEQSTEAGAHWLKIAVANSAMVTWMRWAWVFVFGLLLVFRIKAVNTSFIRHHNKIREGRESAENKIWNWPVSDPKKSTV